MNTINEQLFERAGEVKYFYEGTDVELAIDNLIEQNDLEQLHYLIKQCEAEMSRQEFYNFNLLEATDVY